MRPRPTGQDNIVDAKVPGLSANKLLAALPRDDFHLLENHFMLAPITQRTQLFDAADEVEHVIFPLSGMVSLLVILKNGDAVETATVGREGVVGAMAGLGLHTSHVRAVIQLPGVFARISSTQFRRAAAASKAISDMSIRYNETLLAQARVTAACNISHTAEARFCRWLLQSRDCAESDTVPLTQEFLSEMLGVRRTSVTEVAVKMQDAGIISYSRGIINVIDLAKLKGYSCECYETLRRERSH
jgi:CRP-like cAMP-binding protein